MASFTVIDGNAFYEIDEECMKRKEKEMRRAKRQEMRCQEIKRQEMKRQEIQKQEIKGEKAGLQGR